MKGIRFVELLANIKANIVAFFSISMFVALGLGLFLGIQWGGIALIDAANTTLESGNTHDIELQFPYGITKENIAELKKVKGVSELECGYSNYATMLDGNISQTFKIQSLTKSIDVPTFVAGNLPMEQDEIAVLRSWADDRGIVVGDQITFRHDAVVSDDADGMRYFNADTFTVTALVDNPAYLGRSSASFGVSSTESGVIDCVGFVTEDAFDTQALPDGYTNVYIRCDSLKGIHSFADEYNASNSAVVKAIEKLGNKLGTAQYQKVHDEAQRKLEDVERQIAEGEEKLASGQQAIEEAEKQLADGKEQLESGQKELVEGLGSATEQQSAAMAKLSAAYQQLADGQAKYDAGVSLYNTASDLYNELSAKFNSARSSYDQFISYYHTLRDGQGTFSTAVNEFDAALTAWKNAGDDQKAAAWETVQQKYDALVSVVNETTSNFGTLKTFLESTANILGLPISIGDLPELIPLSEETAESVLAVSQQIQAKLLEALDRITNASITVNGVTISLTDVPGGLQQAYDQLQTTKADLDAAKTKIDAGWSEYNQGKAAYDAQVSEGKAKLSAAEKQLADGQATLKEKTAEAEDAKAMLEEKQAELEEGKAQFEDAKGEFAKLVEYEWVVMPRQDMGGVRSVQTVRSMMNSVKWAMASLFVLVGLFVCYSAISRLVHEQIIQIGTKKALGFHEGEIAFGYLAFSGLAVLLGMLLSLAVATLLVQLIMNPTVSRQFIVGSYAPYFSIPELLLVGSLELALILFATWFAIHGMLKRQATDLLRGETLASAKERFYERTRLWQRMSLFSQTVVNNCVNDKRRVAGTLIGVVGCTALIVTAVSLYCNFTNSFERHYDEVYSYDSVVYLTEESEDEAEQAAMTLYKRGIGSTPAFTRKMQVRQSDGAREVATLMVPTNEESFKKFYHVVSTDGSDANVENGGLWVSAAYAEHTGAHVGDEVVLTEYTGKTHTFKIAGVFDFYLLRHEFVLSQREYREAFGVKPASNALLVNSDGANKSRLRDALLEIDGYSSLADDREDSFYIYGQIESLLRTVVLVYLLLSALMAVMVLLNLDVMFVDEKKKELIVLMICGFSVKDAKAYIWRDSLVLTLVGIVLGIALGTVMGGFTVWALEPGTGYFLKGFNGIAALAGAVGAGFFATAVLLWALRSIPRFDLTDINRF